MKDRHHFVPQLYLRPFADPASRQGELWRYGPGFAPQLKAPKSIAWESKFYDVSGELPEEDNDVEDWFAEIETIAAPHLEKLRQGSLDLDPQERAELGTFISLLSTRTRAHREFVNTLVSKMHVLAVMKTLETEGGLEDLIEEVAAHDGERLDPAVVRQALQAVVDGSVRIEQTSKAWTIKEIFENAKALDALVSEMDWNLLKAPADTPFLTSDNPVIVFDPNRGSNPKGYKPSKNTQLHFPISPSYLLVGDFSGRNGLVVDVPAEMVAKFNENQILSANKEVYASVRSEALQRAVDELFKAKPPAVPDLPPDLLSD
jgi:hypothetical protein